MSMRQNLDIKNQPQTIGNSVLHWQSTNNICESNLDKKNLTEGYFAQDESEDMEIDESDSDWS